jgi:hypothetical protein
MEANSMTKKPRQTSTITTHGRGKALARSRSAAEKRVKDDVQYFIKRDGAWFRPEAHGYTGDIAEAGIFPGSDARGFLSAEGVVLVPIQVMKASIRKQVREHLAKATRLAEIIEGFETEERGRLCAAA